MTNAEAANSSDLEQSELTSEVVRNLYCSNLKAAFVNMLFVQLVLAVILINFASEVVSKTHIIIASVSIFSAYFGRYFLAVAYHLKNARQEILDLSIWLKRYRIAATLCGIAWGGLSAFCYTQGILHTRPFLSCPSRVSLLVPQ